MDKTCEDRIDAELERTLTVLRDLYEMEDWDDYHEEHETNLYEYGLCFDYVDPWTFQDQPEGYWRYQLSYGGPSDEFRFYKRYEGKMDVEYWFLDWFDGAHRILRGTDRELLLNIYERFGS